MIDEARLRSVDDELARLGVDAAKLEAVVARARASRPTLTEADEALAALGSGFDTKVPEGAVARAASWRQASAQAPPREPESGLVEVDEAELAAAPLPAVLSDVPPAGEGEDRISVEIAVEVSPPSGEGAPVDDASASADESGPTTDAPPAPLELELEAAPSPEPTPEPERVRRGTFPPPHDVAHPSPGSVVPPPPADLDAELASILADELEGAEPSGEESLEGELEGELAPEPTALFSAEMFGATEEPSLDKLMSEIPPPMEEAVEIDLDEEVVVEEAAPPPPPRSHAPPPSMTRPPPPPGRSVPPGPDKPGFLGRLLGKKP